MNHWLIALAAREFPDRASWKDLAVPVARGDQWAMVARLARIDTATLASTVARAYSFAVASDLVPDESLAGVLLLKVARKYSILPVAVNVDTFTIAISDPTDQEAITQAAFATGRRVVCQVAPPEDIDAAITNLYSRAQTKASDAAALHMLDIDDSGADLASLDQAPIAKLSRAILKMAVEQRASDVHIHPFAGGGTVRFRVDGGLRRVSTITDDVLSAVQRFLKAQSQMDPTNTRVPQDGRARLNLGKRAFDLRMSTLPVQGGEALVCRLLDQSRVYSLNKMGFSLITHAALQRVCSLSGGLFLLTGPTGCGKTSTLYSMVSQLNTSSRRIITVEEPVEYRVQGVTQVDINPKADLTFASVLRSVLRQDPDILLIGEIRDAETAAIAVNAALTGHLVLSTLHTMDALRTVPRLLELGVRPSVMADVLVGVMSQRLLGRLCNECRVPVVEPLSPLEQLFESLTRERPLFRAAGCSACGFTGYFGRIPIGEVVEVTEEMRTALSKGESDVEKLAQSLPASHQTLFAVAANRVVSGDTTPEEAYDCLGYGFWHSLEKSALAPPPVPISSVLAKFGQTADTAALTALVVGKNPATGKTVLAELAEAGFTAAFVSDPEAARARLERSTEIQFLVLDLSDAGTELLDFVKSLRASLAWAGLPRVVLTSPQTVQTGKEQHFRGNVEVLAAPVSANELISAVRRLLHPG